MITDDLEPLFNQQRPTNFCQDGNAVTVNVAEAIGRRLKEIEDEIN